MFQQELKEFCNLIAHGLTEFDNKPYMSNAELCSKYLDKWTLGLKTIKL